MHNSTGYVIKQLVHAFSCALSSYGALGKFGARALEKLKLPLAIICLGQLLCFFHAFSLHFTLSLHFTPVVQSAFYPCFAVCNYPCFAVCILPLLCSLHFTRSLHFTPGPQSTSCSLHFTPVVQSALFLHLAHSLHPAICILPLLCSLHFTPGPQSAFYTYNKLKNNGDLLFTTTNEHQ